MTGAALVEQGASGGDARCEQHSTDEPLRERFERDGLEQCRRGARVFCAFAVALLIVSAAYSWLYERDDLLASCSHIRISAAGGGQRHLLAARHGASARAGRASWRSR